MTLIWFFRRVVFWLPRGHGVPGHTVWAPGPLCTQGGNQRAQVHPSPRSILHPPTRALLAPPHPKARSLFPQPMPQQPFSSAHPTAHHPSSLPQTPFASPVPHTTPLIPIPVPVPARIGPLVLQLSSLETRRHYRRALGSTSSIYQTIYGKAQVPAAYPCAWQRGGGRCLNCARWRERP